MIIANGTITARESAQSGIDPATGHPIRNTATWGDSTPCQWYPNTIDRRGRVENERFTIARYTVLIEGVYDADRVRLYDDAETLIGEFTVISVERLDAVGQTRILI